MPLEVCCKELKVFGVCVRNNKPPCVKPGVVIMLGVPGDGRLRQWSEVVMR
jgi:hypothetical protein